MGVIPIVGFILMIVWAIGSRNTPVWKRNYARAYFVMFTVLVGISVAFSVVLIGLLGSILGGLY